LLQSDWVMRSSQTTIKDIAARLGISPSTVSRALKDHPDIGIETKRAVRELAIQLNYKPNALAISLRNSRSNIIGVIIPEIVHYFFSTVISGIEDVAYEAGYQVMVCQSNNCISTKSKIHRRFCFHVSRDCWFRYRRKLAILVICAIYRV